MTRWSTWASTRTNAGRAGRAPRYDDLITHSATHRELLCDSVSLPLTHTLSPAVSSLPRELSGSGSGSGSGLHALFLPLSFFLSFLFPFSPSLPPSLPLLVDVLSRPVDTCRAPPIMMGVRSVCRAASLHSTAATKEDRRSSSVSVGEMRCCVTVEHQLLLLLLLFVFCFTP